MHDHGTMQNFGYRFTTQDRVVVWAGDGKVSDSFQQASMGADLLISELCTLKNIGNSPWEGKSFEEKEKIIWSIHLKPKELADLATLAKVKRLIFIHESNYSSPYDPISLLNEIKDHYLGDIISSRDGDVF